MAIEIRLMGTVVAQIQIVIVISGADRWSVENIVFIVSWLVKGRWVVVEVKVKINKIIGEERQKFCVSINGMRRSGTRIFNIY